MRFFEQINKPASGAICSERRLRPGASGGLSTFASTFDTVDEGIRGQAAFMARRQSAGSIEPPMKAVVIPLRRSSASQAAAGDLLWTRLDTAGSGLRSKTEVTTGLPFGVADQAPFVTATIMTESCECDTVQPAVRRHLAASMTTSRVRLERLKSIPLAVVRRQAKASERSRLIADKQWAGLGWNRRAVSSRWLTSGRRLGLEDDLIGAACPGASPTD
jgi:hypothetical protein